MILLGDSSLAATDCGKEEPAEFRVALFGEHQRRVWPVNDRCRGIEFVSTSQHFLGKGLALSGSVEDFHVMSG
jgi:hypothetical protein